MHKHLTFILKSIGLIVTYIVAAKISLNFATVLGNATLVWIPGGLALATILLGGLKYLPSVFVGAFLTSIVLQNPFIINLGTATGNTLETYIAFTFLKHSKFNSALTSTKDFFLLVVLGGLISTIASAVLGPLSLLFAGFITSDLLMKVAVGWWRADVLGIVFFTPIVLLLTQPKAFFTNEAGKLEKLILWLISFIAGQLILVGWVPSIELIHTPLRTAMIFLLLLWASTRTGRRNTALLQLMFLIQGLSSAYFKTGLFANDFAQYGLINFWIFAMLLASAGMMMAILNLENSNAFNEIKIINNQLHSMIEAIPDAIFFKDGDGRWLVVNEFGKKLFHLDQVHWQGKTENELAEMRPEFRQIHDACLVGDNQAWEAKGLTILNESVTDSEGNTRDFDVRKMPIFDKNGDRQSLVIIARDVTKDKILEAALRGSELKWKFVVEGSGSGIWEYNFKTNTNTVSNHLKSMLGFDLTSATYTSELNDWMQRIHPDNIDETINALHAVMENQTEQYVVEQQVLREDGSYIWLFTRGLVVERDSNGKPLLMIGASADITDRQLEKQRLHLEQQAHKLEIEASRDNYQDLYNFSPAGYLTINSDGFISEINVKASKMLGFNYESLMPNNFNHYIADEHQSRWQQLFLKIMSINEEEEEEEEEEEGFELKLRHHDGLTFYTSLNYSPIYKSHALIGIRISLIDITKLKKSEAALRVAAIAFETKEGIFVTDADNKILQVNQAFSDISGYDQNDVVGHTPRILSSGRHKSNFYTKMWTKIKETGNWEGEIWNKRKNGEIYPGKLTITAVTDDSQHVINYVATLVDITTSKEQEEKRLNDEKMLRDTLIREVHHRIKNNLQGVAGLLKNVALENSLLTDPINDAIGQVYSIAVIHGLQGQSSMLNISLCELCKEVAANNQSLWQTTIKINSSENMALFQIAETETVPIALILNELLSNAAKHGDKKNNIEIVLNAHTNNHTAEVRIINTGKLLTHVDDPTRPISGTGLKLVKSLSPSEGLILSWEQHENKIHTILLLTNPVIST